MALVRASLGLTVAVGTLLTTGAHGKRTLTQSVENLAGRAITTNYQPYVNEDLDFDIGNADGVMYDAYHKHEGGVTVLGEDLFIEQDVGVTDGFTFATIYVDFLGQQQGLRGFEFDTSQVEAVTTSLQSLPGFQVTQDADYDVRQLFSPNENTDIGTDSRFQLLDSQLIWDFNSPTNRRRALRQAMPECTGPRVIGIIPAEWLITSPVGGLLDIVLDKLKVGQLAQALGGPLPGVSGSHITDPAALLMRIREEALPKVCILDVVLVGSSGKSGPIKTKLIYE